MRRGTSILGTVAIGVVAAALYAGRATPVQGQAKQDFSVAAVPGEKGGQDIWGAYEPVPDWPKPLTGIAGHEKWTFGAGQGVFAQSPNRVFILQRGELPAVERPKTVKIAPSIEFPIGRLPFRDATSASPPGSLFGPDGKTPGNDLDVGEPGVDFKWEHCIMVVNAAGEMIEDWTQWDKMLRRPHAVYISPYDAEKHVWVVDDYRHADLQVHERRQEDRADARRAERARHR